MGLLSRWLGNSLKPGKPGTPNLDVEKLEPRTTPATLLTPSITTAVLDGGAADVPLAVSADGNYVLFASTASNLVAGATDNNADYDLFWRDILAGTTKLVSTQAGTLNALGFGGSGTAAIPFASRAVLSRDGLRVAYVSAAPASAVTGDSGTLDQLNTTDVFWWRADTGAAKLVSQRVGENAAVGNTLTADATDPAIADDGSFVAYGSKLDAAKIDFSVALDTGDATYDLFRRDMTAADATQATTAVSRIPGKADVVGRYGDVQVPVGAYMSGDARFFAYATTVAADALVGVPDLTNSLDVYVRDMSVNTAAGLTLASVALDGKALGNTAGQDAAAPVISRSGTVVLYTGFAIGGGVDAKQLVAAYVNTGAPVELYARINPFGLTPETKLVSAVNGTTQLGANGFVTSPGAGGAKAQYAVTGDGTAVVFVSAATNLVDATKDPNGAGTDVFVRTFASNATEVVSVGKDGRTGNAPADRPSISDDGRYVAFISAASDLGSAVLDTNNVSDAFVRDRTAGVTRAMSTTTTGLTTGDGGTTSAKVAATGVAAIFVSTARNLGPTPETGTASRVYATALPIASVIGGSSKVVAVSGTQDGLVRNYVVAADGKLTAAGAGFSPFTGVQAVTRVAVGDVNGDGTADTISVIGPGGGSLVKVTDGVSGGDLVAATGTFEASFTGGLFVASADLDADGKAEVIVSPDVGGGGRVQVFSYDGKQLVQRANFFGIDDPNFRGGARVAVGDINGDSVPEIVVGAGFGGGPRVSIYNGATLFAATVGSSPARLFGDFFAFPGEDSTRLRNGVFVAVGDVNGDGRGDLVFGGGPGGGPRVYALSGAIIATDLATAYGSPVANFFAFDSALRGGVRVAVKDLDSDARLDLVVGSGEKTSSQVKTYLSKNLPVAGEPAAFEVVDPFGSPSVAGGVFVG